jgi:uncharacterized RmlC-like cupin family protein
MSDRAFIQMPGAGRVLNMGPFQMTVKADAAQTGGALTVLEADEPAHFGPPLHIHDDAAEAFYVLAGEYLIFVEDEEFRCPSGSFIYIPAGTLHGFRVGQLRAGNSTSTFQRQWSAISMNWRKLSRPAPPSVATN